MTDEFILEIEYKGQLKKLPAQLLLQGYTHRFKVRLDSLEVFFEPDEEGNYRAISIPGQDEKLLEKIDRSLLRAIQEKIQAILA